MLLKNMICIFIPQKQCLNSNLLTPSQASNHQQSNFHKLKIKIVTNLRMPQTHLNYLSQLVSHPIDPKSQVELTNLTQNNIIWSSK